MNPENLEQQLEKLTWKNREFDLHKKRLRGALLEIARKDTLSFSKRFLMRLSYIFMNKKIATLTMIILLVGVGFLGAYVKKSSLFPITNLLIPDVQAHTLVEIALQKIEEITQLTPPEQKKLLQEKITQGLQEAEPGDSSIYERWPLEERLQAFEHMYVNLDKTLTEAGKAQDLKVLNPEKELKNILESWQLMYYDIYSFSFIGFNYAGPRLAEQTSSKKDEAEASEDSPVLREMMQERYQKQGFSTSTIEELLRPARTDEKIDFIIRDELNSSMTMSFKPTPLEIQEKTSKYPRIKTTVIYFTDSQGSPTLVWFDYQGLPTQVFKKIVNDEQITEIMQQNMKKIVARIPSGHNRATLTPEQAVREIQKVHENYEWQFLGLDWETVKKVRENFDFTKFDQVDKIERYTEKRTTGALTYVWMKDNTPLLVVKKFPGKKDNF